MVSNFDYLWKGILVVTLASIFWGACKQSDDTSDNNLPVETYPSRFKYDRLDFRPSSFYVLTSNAYNGFTPSGDLAGFDTELLASFSGELPEVEYIDLLTPDKILFTSFPPPQGNMDTLTLSYTKDSNRLNFMVSGIDEPLTLIRDFDANALLLPIFTYAYSNKNPVTNKVEYSPIIPSAFLSVPDIPAYINTLRNAQNLQVGDTIVLNESYYFFEKQ